MATLSAYTHLSDVAQMADGSVWIGRYDTAGASIPLLRVASYEQSFVGLCGDRSVYETTAQVTECAGPAAGKGITSLHPAGYALAHSSAGKLQLWRYAAGDWSLLTETDPEPMPEALIGTPLLGAYRLDVIGGDLYVLPRNGDNFCGFVLRGSVLRALPPWDSQDAQGLPLAVRGYLSAVAPRTIPWTQNAPLTCFWRGYWHYVDVDMLRRAGDAEWQVPFHPGAALINVQGALTVIGETAESYFPSESSEFPLPDGAAAAGFLSYYGNRLQRGLVNMYPFAARSTGSVLWCIGINAFDLLTHKQEMIGPGGYEPVFYAFPWATAALRLYSVGPVPDKVCALSATLEWAETPVSPNLLSATLEWSTGAGEQRPAVTAATLEWAAGSGSARPAVTAATLEWHSSRRPSITAAMLEWAEERARAAALAATLEWATGAGTEKPSLTAATLEWSAGSGEARPSVTAATLEWADVSARPSLLEAGLEWAQTLPISETVGVCWRTIALPGKVVNLVRLTEVALDSGFTWIVRTNDTDPVDAYGSYIELIPYALTEVPAGSMVRLGVIGPLAQEVPTSTLQLYCEPTAI